MKTRFLAALAVVLALSGCGTMNRYAAAANNYLASNLEASKSNVQAVNDTNAKVLSDAACATPYGELVRNGSGNPNFPKAIVALCGDPSGMAVMPAAPK